MARLSPRPVRRAGSMIIELIIVAFLIGSVGISIYLSLLYGAKVAARAHHRTIASQIASTELETHRTESYASITVPYSGPLLGSRNPADELPGGAGELEVSYYNSPTNTIKMIVATVSWDEQGVNNEVSYTTFVTEAGFNR